MQVIICKNYDEASRKSADVIAAEIKKNPKAILGLATGNTPIGTYACLVDAYNKGELDFAEVRSYNLDEYLPIEPSDPNSYNAFMHYHLWDKVNMKPENCHIPAGNVSFAEAPAMCEAYDKEIAAAGGIDIQLLGVGRNGHLGFNEPAEVMQAGTHVTGLTDSTVAANSVLFENPDDMPRNAVTMGLGSIFAAKKLLVVALGKNKHEAVKAILADGVTTSCPASLLKLHRDVVLVVDEEAYNG